MADAPPAGPPPPKVPEGWKAVWNSQYNEWFYVNKFTKVSQWDKPTEPALDPNARGEHAPAGPPPAYLPSSSSGPQAHGALDNEKHNPNNPYNQSGNVDEDARLAAKLQAEENARSSSSRPLSTGGGSTDRGAADSYYNTNNTNTPGGYGQQQQSYSGQQQGHSGQQNYSQNPTSPSYQQQSSPKDAKRGFLGKLLGKSSSHSQPQQQQQYPPQQQYYGQGYPPQQQYGGYPQQQGYGGYPPQGYAQRPQKSGGGMGAGGMMLGAGAGLVGGALLMNAFDDHEQYEQQQAYEDGQDQGYDQGYDAGMDDGGGDF